ncbi:putative membrane transporter protein YfcA [Zhongshania aliphaticivorans]|uniref:Probable membrane transporter protein n=1 Tax=Zhongshania aliphaticivorans TaxID=1470434 RepID=A0A5S9P5V4_9GAMM|nr:sulfite exporter TauE/SafE family protein [Zhongshania aliphaticivorans]CAA0091285.1 putative membrane transporter protein YfcA [Zhongshania aliphaticivorans]CAA0098705.1 putative membrane transporter protein YfcA [Zhongshania aliphaticivorans]
MDVNAIYSVSPWFAVLLIAVGIVAGVINTLAGGGSNLTLPALMLMGLPADVANATNRVGVLMQSVAAAKDFDKHGQLARHDLLGILKPTLLGSLVGAVIAAFAPSDWLKPALLIAMVSMALIILIRPNIVAPPLGTKALSVSESPKAWGMLFVAGIYGGFVQAGVGFILIAALAGGLRYDLVKTNAIKLVCAAALTLTALAVFVWQGLVAWLPGLILAVGTVIGAKIGVRVALNISPQGLKWFLFIMTVAASAAALFKT